MKHSSYTYQKLFRALYGYTQAVFKGNGKTYHYHREGILSKYPFIRPGKNCVIIPPAAFQDLIEFFKTGRNPSHRWSNKGEWKAVYYMNEKTVPEKDAISALEELLSREIMDLPSGGFGRLEDEINTLADAPKPDEARKNLALSVAQKIVEMNWFKEAYSQSPKLKAFYEKYKQLRGA